MRGNELGVYFIADRPIGSSQKITYRYVSGSNTASLECLRSRLLVHGFCGKLLKAGEFHLFHEILVPRPSAAILEVVVPPQILGMDYRE